MAEDNNQDLAKCKALFERAEKVAWTNNFDYAIELYLDGLRCAPDDLENGHIKLRGIALLRQVKGGKKPSMMEKIRYRGGKTPLDQMISAEYLFTKDPDNLAYAEAMLKAAITGGHKKTAAWLADLMFQANNNSEKPSLQTYLLLKNSYISIGQLDRALVACQYAQRLKPSDTDLSDEVQRLAAELTVSKGKYDQAGDFRNSIKDRDVQEKLQMQDSVVKTKDYRTMVLEEARKALEQNPNLPKNIFNLAKALEDFQTDQADSEAIEFLENTYKAKNDFSFKQQAGLMKIKQLRRKIRDEKTALETNPGNADAKARFIELSAILNNIELEHYRLCVQNYPTDLQLKYEYGARLVRNKQYDEAIPLLQDAQRDPRHRLAAMDKIGLSFFMKGWYTDAIDVFNRAIDSYEIKDDSIAKELRYNLARSYQEHGDTEKAIDIYRKIAQLDFGYKDVRQRVDDLRNKKAGPASQ